MSALLHRHYLFWAPKTRLSTRLVHIPFIPEAILGACNPLEGHHRQRNNLCEQSCVSICKASNRCGKWGTCLFWGGTNSSVHATSISGTAVLPQLAQVILPSACVEQIPAVTLQHHQHTHAFLFKALPKHSPINPASTSEKQTPLLSPNYWLGSQGMELEAWQFTGTKRH